MRNPNNTKTHRQCTSCKEIYPLTKEYFQTDKSKSNGFSNRCRKCTTKRELIKRKLPENRSKNIIRYYIDSDKKKNRPTYLTVDFINFSLSKSCTYCGYPPTGLDRIDNNLGHTEDNCVPCCRECNIARMNNFTYEEMKIIGRAIKIVKDARR